MKTFLVKRGAVFIHFSSSRNDIMESAREFEALKIKGWDEDDARTTLRRDFGQVESDKMELTEVRG